MNVGAVITAGGSGTRMQSDKKKQYLSIAGEPILIHAARPFFANPKISYIVIVVPDEDCGSVNELLKGAFYKVPFCVVPGGARRQDSVKNGLITLCTKLYSKPMPENEKDIVLIHDGVRPFIDQKLIDASIDAAAEYGAAVVSTPVTDTIKEQKNNFVSATPERDQLVAVQTPQTFSISLLWDAFEKYGNETVTDDAMLVERTGKKVYLVPGSRDNIKITTPIDLLIAEAIFQQRQTDEGRK